MRNIKLATNNTYILLQIIPPFPSCFNGLFGWLRMPFSNGVYRWEVDELEQYTNHSGSVDVRKDWNKGELQYAENSK